MNSNSQFQNRLSKSALNPKRLRPWMRSQVLSELTAFLQQLAPDTLHCSAFDAATLPLDMWKRNYSIKMQWLFSLPRLGMRGGIFTVTAHNNFIQLHQISKAKLDLPWWGELNMRMKTRDGGNLGLGIFRDMFIGHRFGVKSQVVMPPRQVILLIKAT